MANSFAAHTRGQAEEQDLTGRLNTLSDVWSALAELDRERREYRRQLQAQSSLRFHVGQLFRVLRGD